LTTAVERVAGWRPTPFREFVLKVTQRCNLVCDYCYVYTKADQSWRGRPPIMPAAVVATAARRIAEHADAHDLAEVHVILHGGEPLLLGAARLVDIAGVVRAAVGPRRRIRVSIQTNGVLLTTESLDILVANGIGIGVSIDGAAPDHDRHRRFARGRGSHAAVARALRLLGEPAHRPSFNGLLCTIDLATEPVRCYEEMLRHAPPSIDFLLPHANWADPPSTPNDAISYSEWLIAVFERWYGSPRQETRVPILEEIIHLILGGAGRSEHVGLSPVALVVIDSDGAIEQVDTLKSAYAGAAGTGLHVDTDALDKALAHPGIVARQVGVRALCDTCRSCAVHRICGGGNYAHRYSPGTGFRNPSVHCRDLFRLITHIGRRLREDLATLARSAA
jgi:uncharacterized protein